MLLAVDTSTRTIGVALYDGERVLAESVWSSPDHHSVELAPAVAAALERTGLRPRDLRALGVAIGPGSFTALRVGLAFIKGLSLANNLPIVGVPTLDSLAAAQPLHPERMAAVLRAGRGRLAVGWYVRGESGWQPEGPVIVLTPAELASQVQKPTRICGELTAEEQRLLARKRKNVSLSSPAFSVRRPGFLAELAWQRWQAGKVDDPAQLAPIYLHYNQPVPE